MKIFKNYLDTKNYSSSTKTEIIRSVKRFLKWYSQNHPEKASEFIELTVIEMVEYINTLQARQLDARTINNTLSHLRKYFYFLVSQGYVERLEVSLQHITVKGVAEKLVINPLDYSELQQLYKAYIAFKKEEKPYQKTALERQAMLGFMIFQGLPMGALKRLEKDHINDEDGTVYIMGARMGKVRTLPLNPQQMKVLFTYLGRLESDQIFLFSGNVNYQMNCLLEELRGINPSVQNGSHLRSSVIMEWLKVHGKRKTQYMAGHKCIQSTEKYEKQNLEALTDLLTKCHPQAFKAY